MSLTCSANPSGIEVRIPEHRRAHERVGNLAAFERQPIGRLVLEKDPADENRVVEVHIAHHGALLHGHTGDRLSGDRLARSRVDARDHRSVGDGHAVDEGRILGHGCLGEKGILAERDGGRPGRISGLEQESRRPAILQDDVGPEAEDVAQAVPLAMVPGIQAGGLPLVDAVAETDFTVDFGLSHGIRELELGGAGAQIRHGFPFLGQLGAHLAGIFIV